jgi:hypothetical protein
MRFRNRNQPRRSGCLPLTVACITTCCLLIINRGIALSLYQLLVPEALNHPKVQMLATMIMTVGLLLPEWLVLDWGASRLWRASEEPPRRVR